MRRSKLVLPLLCLAVTAPIIAQTPRRAADVSVPIQVEDARVYVPVTVSDSTYWFILDTGAQSTLLDDAVARAAGIPAKSPTTTTGAGGGRVAIAHADDVTVHVGTVAVGPQAVIVAPLDSLIGPSSGRTVSGILGSRFFREHVVVLDFANSTMRIADPATFHDAGNGVVVPLDIVGGTPYARGTIDTPNGRSIPMKVIVDLGAKASVIQIKSVAAGSPAAANGLRPGDRIIGLDDIAGSRLTLAAVRQRFRGPTGSRVRVLIDRHGQRFSRELVLRPVI